MEDAVPTFWIGHHDGKQQFRVSPELIQRAHMYGYDMITSPITTPFFHSRVLALLSSAQAHAVRSDGDAEHPASEGPSRLVVPPMSPADSNLTPDESMSQVVATTSSWIDLCSPDPLVADVSKQVLILEIAYAAFCGVSYVLIPGPRYHQRQIIQAGLMQYARATQEALAIGSYMQVKIWLPLIDHPDNETPRMGDLALLVRPEYMADEEGDDAHGLDLYGSWDAWNVIRSFCRYHARLCVALIVPKHLPPATIQSRWYTEPVKLLTFDSTSFTKNARGYPVLTKPHQTLISRYMRLRLAPWILLGNVGALCGTSDPVPASEQTATLAANSTLPGTAASFPTLAEAARDSIDRQNDPVPHLSYMRHLQNQQPPQSQLERFSSGYQDYLQAPLQPLTVNLESITYEVFEKDPVKYDWYERAVARALHDWVEQRKPASNPDGRVVVAVVGAGRGPLVTRALRASEDVGIDIDIWALEKNANAFVLLQHHNANPELWADRVKLVKSDMRTWRGPWRRKDISTSEPIGQAISPESASSPAFTDRLAQETPSGVIEGEHYPVDILISELLGSFGDNELSPECLDGVQHLLNTVHGISIPASYTAHLTPIAAPKLHADISMQAVSNPNAPETPYVVMLHAIDYLSTAFASPNTQKAPATPPPNTPTPNPIIHKAWSFTHPHHHYLLEPTNSTTMTPTTSIAPTTAISNSHNARHTTLSFPIPHRGTIHGLAGYFEAVLYGTVELSTNPLTMDQKSESMISWFPIYFPLKNPMYVPDNSEIVVNMWRQTDDRKVWYEWIVEVFAVQDLEPAASGGKGKKKAAKCEADEGEEEDADDDEGADVLGRGKEQGPTSSNNIRGRGGRIRRKTRVAISDLHSSIKEACLM